MKRVALFLIAALPFLGCEEAKKDIVDPPATRYETQTSPENVLHNLQVSYLSQDPAGYSRLLADDFRFFLDEGTRQQNQQLPVFWTADTDSAQTGLLFAAPEITDIRILLQYGTARPVQESGRESWVYINVLDTFLEVDIAPGPGQIEGYTPRVDGQQQRFYFRKGKTPEDTGSETWYLVEWKDFGMDVKGGVLDRLLVENTTWSAIKALSR